MAPCNFLPFFHVFTSQNLFRLQTKLFLFPGLATVFSEGNESPRTFLLIMIISHCSFQLPPPPSSSPISISPLSPSTLLSPVKQAGRNVHSLEEQGNRTREKRSPSKMPHTIHLKHIPFTHDTGPHSTQPPPRACPDIYRTRRGTGSCSETETSRGKN